MQVIVVVVAVVVVVIVVVVVVRRNYLNVGRTLVAIQMMLSPIIA